MKFRPLQDRIIVKLVPETTGVVVVLKPPAGETRRRGEVVAVGEGTRFSGGNLVPVKVVKGDVVLFENGSEIKIEGEEMILIREGDVVGICGNIHEERLARSIRKN